MRFDYLHDSVPDTIDRLRAVRIPEYLQWPVWTFVAVLLVSAAGAFILRWGNGIAENELANAQARLAQSTSDLARVRLEHTHVEDLLVIDRRLRDIHLSGSMLSGELADVANHMPSHAWLTSIDRTADGLSITGRAKGLNVLSDTFADLLSSKTVAAPTLVRAGKDGTRLPGVLAFEVHVEDRAR